jgi:hypothetical protein
VEALSGGVAGNACGDRADAPDASEEMSAEIVDRLAAMRLGGRGQR